jgi:hypothetical protein
MDQSLINRIVEGALLASSQPLTLAQLKDLFPEEEPAPPGSIERALERLRPAKAVAWNWSRSPRLPLPGHRRMHAGSAGCGPNARPATPAPPWKPWR